MKKFILSSILCVISHLCIAQKSYDINDESYYLIKETNGSIVLLWNVINGKDRYFVKANDSIVELVNTKDKNHKHRFEYKTVLANLTSDKTVSVEKVKLKLMSLKRFIDKYNGLKDPDYEVNTNGQLLTRFTAFAGLSNSPFLDNPSNTKNPVFGAEFEFSEFAKSPRHSIYFQGKQMLGSDDFDYNATSIVVGYRFRIINKEAFTLYTSVDLARYMFTKTEKMVHNENDEVDYVTVKENGFEAPLVFNLGADIRLTDTSFLTLTYNELFSVLLDSQTHFPFSFTAGYKLNL
jgi:hypothetical protein